MTTATASPSTPSLDNFPWSDLMRNMKREWIIPVVGSELYQHNHTDPTQNYRLYSRVASELMTGSGQAKSAVDEAASIFARDRHYFHKAAAIFLSTLGPSPDYTKLTDKIEEFIQKMNFVPSPDLLRLAQISKFKIFINTTYDHFLYHALKSAGRRKVKVYNYALMQMPIEQWEAPEPDETIILNVFGNFKNKKPSYTEKDIIESVTNFQNDIRNTSHNSFMDKLKSDSYLFIGCSFKNWLQRFVMRSISNSPFDPVNTVQSRFFSSDILLTDPEDVDFKAFLETVQSNIFYTGTNKFMDALWEKVTEENKANNDWILDLHCCFVSFHGKDREHAEKIDKNLSAKVKTWFDTAVDRSGNVVDDTIKSAICRSQTFLAIISDSFIQRPGYQGQEIWWLDRLNKDDRSGDPINVRTLIIGDVDKDKLPQALNRNFWYTIPNQDLDSPEAKATIEKLTNDIKNDCR